MSGFAWWVVSMKPPRRPCQWVSKIPLLGSHNSPSRTSRVRFAHAQKTREKHAGSTRCFMSCGAYAALSRHVCIGYVASLDINSCFRQFSRSSLIILREGCVFSTAAHAQSAPLVDATARRVTLPARRADTHEQTFSFNSVWIQSRFR